MTRRSEIHLLIKRGFYYRPNSAGYTGVKREAGRYALVRAAVESLHDGVTMINEDDAPQFSTRCPDDAKVCCLLLLVEELRAQIRELIEAHPHG